jgi:hypothetical protein
VFVYYDQQDQSNAEQQGGGRYVPYASTPHDPAGSYYDFRAQPVLIDQVLEDFLPYAEWPAVGRFYELLRWINGQESIFESTDCLLRPIAPNITPHLGEGASSQLLGRLMIIYRDHARNTAEADLHRLFSTVHQEIANVDPTWLMGAIGYAPYAAHFTALGAQPMPGTTGFEMCLRFWAWGNDDAECFANLDRLFANLRAALENADRKLRLLT